MEYTIEKLVSQQEIQEKVKEIGALIKKNYQGEDELLLVGLLKGSAIFLSDLAREIDLDIDVKFDFMVVSSYGNSTESSREVKIKKDIEEDICGKNVIIVEDIIDTGYTLEKVREILLIREPKSLAICTLLDKPERREVKVPVDYVGFTIPDYFVIGYGIDYAQKHRNLPYIGKVVVNS
ncbi:MAG: hypoxanthine phosphoribosyltransferase [Spirochaetes bacterium]|nr:hypoxanthine phosphoribosyltransferase [Spirochaetota bacterium]